MKLITRNTDYAVRALCYLAVNDGEIVSVADLVLHLKTPRPFLRKILQALNNSGIVTSYKGQGGGFVLAKRPSAIYVSDVIETFQGPIRLNECLLNRKTCPNRSHCSLRRSIDKVEKLVKNEFGGLTIKGLIS